MQDSSPVADEREAAGDQVAMQVVRHIRNQIEQGTLVRGERLPPEREFARDLKVSRASLRAGVGTLAAMGVLTVRHGVGTFVSNGPPTLNPTTFELMYSLHGFTRHQLFESRFIVEGSLAALAAERGRDEHFEALYSELDGMEATHADPPTFLIHDVSFHRIIGEASGNPILNAFMETISARFYASRRDNIGNATDTEMKQATAMHREILTALNRHEPAEARRLMELHLLQSEQSQAAPTRS